MDWLKFRWFYLLISGTVIGAGIFGYFKWGFKIGIDFTGGVVAEYRLADGSIKTVNSESEAEALKAQGATELRFEKIGPTICPELVKKTLYALLLSTGLILLWIAIQFKSFKFGISATLATFHDSLVLLGLFTLLGHFYGAEIDFLFVTALLTTLSFSVHDTIVVFDRIREKRKKEDKKISLAELANQAISETMARSINNSLTIVFMLVALIFWGGETIRWFAVALLIGTVSGTYSSPFVAVPILVTWDEIQKRLKN